MPFMVSVSARDWNAQITISTPMQHNLFAVAFIFGCTAYWPLPTELHTSLSRNFCASYRTYVFSRHQFLKSLLLSSGKRSSIFVITSSNASKFFFAPGSRYGRTTGEDIPIPLCGPNNPLAFSIHSFIMIESKFNISSYLRDITTSFHLSHQSRWELLSANLT